MGVTAGLATRTRTRVVVGLLVLVVIALAVDTLALWRAQRLNATIAAGGAAVDSAAPSADAPPEWRFAQAHAHAQGGAPDVALNRYRALQSDPRLGAAARYNSANLLVRQALTLRAGTQPGQAIAPLELAKEYYRDVLRDDPAQWDARYNLERTQRLLPDAEDADVVSPDAVNNRERAATTMRGYSPGLP
jgi:mxaK protein